MDDEQYNRCESWDLPIAETDTDLCRALWLSVAIQALVDAKTKSGKRRNHKRRAEALQWLAALEGKESEFALICDLAGIDFDETRKRFSKALHNDSDSIDFRCLKKFRPARGKRHSQKREIRKRRLKHFQMLFPSRYGASELEGWDFPRMATGGKPVTEVELPQQSTH